MTNPRESYDWLLDDAVQTAYLASLGEVAAWDQRTHIPGAGHPHRAEQLARLTVLLHERSTAPEIGEHLAIVEGTELVSEPTATEAVNARQWRREYDRATRIPSELAVELSRATSAAESAWERARPEGNWASFAPHLARVFELLREKADALGYEDEPYDALVEDYEPGQTAASLAPIFDELRTELVALLDRLREVRERASREPLERGFGVDLQERFCRQISAALGYDYDAGRLDVSAHPFTIGIGPGDVRITTRFNERDLGMALFGTIHEAGHGMYEQGLPAEHYGTPRGDPASLGVHESQSRLWENLVGRSAGFWRWALPQARRILGDLDDVTPERMYRAVNTVRPSLIRVEADEVTYNLHILLRFELEIALLRGDLSTDDLPTAWDEKMEQTLGVRPTDTMDGVLQDVHWSAGLVGYFPTYTLGNLYAAQLFEAARDDLGDLEAAFEQGEFVPLLRWLRDRVHALGSTHLPADLIERVTGRPPTAQPFIDYCKEKYEAL
jgi:carboxypeptidase Taq